MHIQRSQKTRTDAETPMAQLRKSINRAKGFDELLPLISTLSRETEAMMNDRTLDPHDIHRIAVPLAKIRFLLATIVPFERKDGSAEESLVRDLVEQYRDIEGRIKEMRNDLSGARKPQGF